jgi:hypothetical protein
MNNRYVLLGMMFLLSCLSFGQTPLFRGNWYTGVDIGISSSRTRMSAGELGKYNAGWSGTMPMYGLRVGRIMSPFSSLETGIYTLPLNLVYLYETDRAIGANPLHFVMIPLRAKWRVRVLHERLEGHLGGGIQYVWTGSEVPQRTFQGTVVERTHPIYDSLTYRGQVNVLRRHAFNAEISASLNWALSRRWTLSVYGRQLIGLMNVASVNVTIQNNNDPAENAEFVTKSAGFNAGVGIRYNLYPKLRLPKQ